MSKDNTLSKAATVAALVKTLGGWIVALIIMALSVVFWIQNFGNDKYFPKLAGENLQAQIQGLDKDLDEVQKQNGEMLRLLYEMKGARERHGRP